MHCLLTVVRILLLPYHLQYLICRFKLEILHLGALFLLFPQLLVVEEVLHQPYHLAVLHMRYLELDLLEFDIAVVLWVNAVGRQVFLQAAHHIDVEDVF